MLANLISTLPIILSRKKVFARRKYFFDMILHLCSIPPDAASVLMGQHVYDVPANVEKATNDPENGLLVFEINADFHGLKCHHTYSLYQIGDMLKVGLLLADGLEMAVLTDVHREMHDLWHGTPFATHERSGYTLYEWTFKVPNLYKNWIEQEIFTSGMKHCKMRVLRVLNDYASMRESESASKR